jgi:hypothetical protein
MCHGYEWELLRQAHIREVERRKREQQEGAKAPPAATPQPAPTPVRNEDPVPA